MLNLKLPTNVRRLFAQQLEGPLYHASDTAWDKVDMTKMGFRDNFGQFFHGATDPETAVGYGDTVRTFFLNRGEGLDLYNLGPDHLQRLKQAAESPLEREAFDHDLALVQGRRAPEGAELVQYHRPARTPGAPDAPDTVYPTATHEVLENNPGVMEAAGYSAVKHHDIVDQNWAILDPSIAVDIEGNRLGDPVDPLKSAILQEILHKTRNLGRGGLEGYRAPASKYDNWRAPDPVVEALAWAVGGLPDSAASRAPRALQSLLSYVTGQGRGAFHTLNRDYGAAELDALLQRIRAPQSPVQTMAGRAWTVPTRFSEKVGPLHAPVEHRGTGFAGPTLVGRQSGADADSLWNHVTRAWTATPDRPGNGNPYGGPSAPLDLETTTSSLDAHLSKLYPHLAPDPSNTQPWSGEDLMSAFVPGVGFKSPVAVPPAYFDYENMAPQHSMLATAQGQPWATLLAEHPNALGYGMWDADQKHGATLEAILMALSKGGAWDPLDALSDVGLSPHGFRVHQPAAWNPRTATVEMLDDYPELAALLDPEYLNHTFDRNLFSTRVSPKQWEDPTDFTGHFFPSHAPAVTADLADKSRYNHIVHALRNPALAPQTEEALKTRIAQEADALPSGHGLGAVRDFLRKTYGLGLLPPLLALQQARQPRKDADDA